MHLRIIGGKYKGRLIHPHKSFRERCTTDLAKESLFNIINNNFFFEEIKVLDLFSGTGNISYEFASRGCTDITLVDINYKNIAFIKKTAKELNLTGNGIKAIQSNAFRFIKFCKTTYDIIFADPPYRAEGIESLPDLIFDNKLLKKDGWLIIEHSKTINFSEHPDFFEKRTYGNVNFSFFC